MQTFDGDQMAVHVPLSLGDQAEAHLLTFSAVALQIQTVAKTARIHRNEWVENADRLVAGFLEMFEEHCHKMVSSLSLSLSLTLEKGFSK
jgi:hypothetical protein